MKIRMREMTKKVGRRSDRVGIAENVEGLAEVGEGALKVAVVSGAGGLVE